jgi:L-aminopeptidase/D-esterase-like protein
MLRTPSGRARARALGIPFEGRPGALNSITDIAGLEVGYTTLISGSGERVVGRGPIRTGVTAILPRGRARAASSVWAGYFSLNGNGELTGCHWVEEIGRCDGPITITNTHSCGAMRDATIKWLVARMGTVGQWTLPVAGETFDGYLNDINGFHVRDEHVFAALDGARGGAIEEGSVGGGTGMICYGFKGGSGTASRRVGFAGADYHVAAFVQSNFGRREQLTIAGVPVGRALADWQPEERAGGETGSVIAILATDAPLLAHQLKRLARRIGLGIGRAGATSGHGSGDIFLAFSTANADALHSEEQLARANFIPDAQLNPFFDATIQAVDEAVINSLVANETMQGCDDHVIHALPHDEVRRLLRDAKVNEP